jgi:hypothetical protein
MVARKDARIHRMGCLFRDNLRERVSATRARLQKEQLLIRELEELERNKEKPIVLKKVPLEPKNPMKLICFRTECKLRTFLSMERYEVSAFLPHIYSSPTLSLSFSHSLFYFSSSTLTPSLSLSLLSLTLSLSLSLSLSFSSDSHETSP